jgi:hypothetical protein
MRYTVWLPPPPGHRNKQHVATRCSMLWPHGTLQHSTARCYTARTLQPLCSFLCPCIATPMQYNVVDHQPDKLGTRALTLVTKVIQASPWAGRCRQAATQRASLRERLGTSRGLLCVCALPARLGSARLGSARLGSARLGSARLGSARLGSVGAEPETTAALRTLVLFVCLLLCLCADRCRAAVLRRKPCRLCCGQTQSAEQSGSMCGRRVALSVRHCRAEPCERRDVWPQRAVHERAQSLHHA